MSFLAALHRTDTLSVYSWTFFCRTFFCSTIFFPQSAGSSQFCTQTILPFDDRNLSFMFTVSFTTLRNNVPSDDFQQQTTRLVTVQHTGRLVIQEFKFSSHSLHPNYIHVLCVPNQTQPGHFEFSADISYQPTWRLVSFGTFRHEQICAHTV